jgi:putative oxidoreductase
MDGRGVHRLLAPAGRALMSGIFISGGWAAFTEPGPRTESAASLGVPEPELAVRANGLAMIVGGTALAIGVWPRAAAAGLIASLVPTTVAGHPFWDEDDSSARARQRTQFLKNLAIIGGLVVFLASGETR